MKAIVVFQFYFPYVLPRANDWPTEPFAFKYPDFTVALHPRNPDEELFPEDIDKTLSTMEVNLSRISLPTSATTTRVRDRCRDRIEVRVHGELASRDDTKREQTQDAFLAAAIQACNLFLAHCRVAGRAPFVTGIEREYRLQDERYYVLTPHTVSWFSGEDGKHLPAYEGEVNGYASSGAIRAPEREGVSFASIRQTLEAGEQPSVAVSLLVDASEGIMTLRLREAIIALGTACEIASAQYLGRMVKDDDSRVERILAERVSFAEKRFNRIPSEVSGRSLKGECSETFDLVEKMYRTRNNVVHEGRAYYMESGEAINVDQRLASQFLAATEGAVDWLAGL